MPEFISDDWFMREGNVRAAFIIFELRDIFQCHQSHTAHNLYRALILARSLVEKLVDDRLPPSDVIGMIVNPHRRTWEVLVVHPVFDLCAPAADIPYYLLRDARSRIFAYEETRPRAPTNNSPESERSGGPRRVNLQ